MRVELKIPVEALLFYSVIYSRNEFSENDVILALELGTNYKILRPQENPSLDYYSKEMGSDLTRIIICSKTAVSRNCLVEAKLFAVNLEKKFSKNNVRLINIDPGLLTLENMVLATSKPYSHRIYLDQGVYADLNYTFIKGSYEGVAWTYPDYLHPDKLKFFEDMRNFLKDKISKNSQCSYSSKTELIENVRFKYSNKTKVIYD